MNKRKTIDVMRTLFRVWHGTENSRDILEDTARTIGHRGFGLVGAELDKFAIKCAQTERETP